jgi:hypothetical protein
LTWYSNALTKLNFENKLSILGEPIKKFKSD